MNFGLFPLADYSEYLAYVRASYLEVWTDENGAFRLDQIILDFGLCQLAICFERHLFWCSQFALDVYS